MDNTEQVYGALTGDQEILTTGILALFLGGSEDSFTGVLLYLIAKGHPNYDGTIAKGFPEQVRAYQVWMAATDQPTAAQLAAAIARDQADRDNHVLGYARAHPW